VQSGPNQGQQTTVVLPGASTTALDIANGYLNRFFSVSA
jgi:hypothetical protein